MGDFTNKDRENLTKCATLLETHLPRLDDHEKRVRTLEKNQTRLMTLASAFSAAIAAMVASFIK